MGNLGWEAPAQEFAERARQCLAAAGVPPTAVVTLAAVVGRSAWIGDVERQTRNDATMTKLATQDLASNNIEGTV